MRERLHDLRALYLSFFSQKLYERVLATWAGIGLGYLVMVTGLAAAVLSVREHYLLRQCARETVPQCLAALPPLTVKDGLGTLPGPQPLVLKDPASQRVLLYADTSDSPVEAKVGQDATMLIAQKGIVTLVAKSQPLIFRFRQGERAVPDGTYDREQLQALLAQRPVKQAYLETFPMFWLVFLVLHQVLALSGAGYIYLMHRQNPKVPPFASCLRLAAVAMTPPLFLGTLAMLVGLLFPGMFLVYLLIVFGYVMFAAQAVPTPPAHVLEV